MPRDYRLYELTDHEFEMLIVRICIRWLGEGVRPFAPGRDGGRDGAFHGKANEFPSRASPLEGHVVLQAKHVNQPGHSCSDRAFEGLLKDEHGKIARLFKEGLCDHYLLFTNRRLPAGADKKHVKAIMALGPAAYIIGVERIHLALDDNPAMAAELPNRLDSTAFRFNSDDLIEVIGALHDYAGSDDLDGLPKGATDFARVSVRTQKNRINGLSQEFWDQIIVPNSMPHFANITTFLKNPRNRELSNLYADAADEIRQKVFAYRADFESFDKIFPFLYDQIQQKRDALHGKRRMISILLHYMYYMCDIGQKAA